MDRAKMVHELAPGDLIPLEGKGGIGRIVSIREMIVKPGSYEVTYTVPTGKEAYAIWPGDEPVAVSLAH